VHLSFSNVSYAYDGVPEPAVQGLTFTLRPGWTGVVGANGSGKTTVLRLAAGLLGPTAGHASLRGMSVHCPQRTDDPPDGLEAFLDDPGSRACQLRQILGLAADWPRRWGTLSHGERKRAQVGAALYLAPEVLGMDEPTNHLDRETRDRVLRALESFRGIGLLVSHDRDLLDHLCAQCLFLHGGEGVMRPGGYGEGSREEVKERTAQVRARDKASREVKKLHRELDQRREQTAKGERQRSKRGLAKGDRDGKAKVDAARCTDSGSGQRLRQLEGRMRQALERESGLNVARDFTLGLGIAGQRSPRDLLLAIPSGTLALGGGRQLEVPALVVRPEDRIGLEGPNGTGKSTLVRRVVEELLRTGVRVAYLPQETTAADARRILKNVLDLPPDQLGRAMALLRRLGSDPSRLLQSAEPSPGELRKLLLASHPAPPHILVLDEPTNHLDVAAVECLEEALADFPAAMVMVSHDARFLRRLATRRWVIEPAGEARWILAETS